MRHCEKCKPPLPLPKRALNSGNVQTTIGAKSTLVLDSVGFRSWACPPRCRNASRRRVVLDSGRNAVAQPLRWAERRDAGVARGGPRAARALLQHASPVKGFTERGSRSGQNTRGRDYVLGGC